MGQEIPIRTGSLIFQNEGSNLPRTQTDRKEIGVELRVTPYINHDGSIRMTVFQKVESVIDADLGIGDSGFADVVTSLSRITTEVIAEDGQTIVLGGLIGDEESQSTQRVPGLSSIPILGRLFRSNSTSTTRRHLLVFIRPTILESPVDILAENRRKFRRIWEVSLEEGKGVITDGQDNEEEPPELDVYFDGD